MATPDRKFERLNIQLDTEMYLRLNDLATLTKWSVADIIRRCVAVGLDAVKQQALADPEVVGRVKEQQKRLNILGRDLLALHQDPPRGKK